MNTPTLIAEENNASPTPLSKHDPEGSFIRWQSITIAQLAYAINLILGFSVATLAFQVTTLLNEKFNPVSWQKCAFSLSLLLLLISVSLGILCVINRLRDFRTTTKVAKMREEKKSEGEIRPYRDLYKMLGNRTWTLFWWQLGTFGVGVFLLVIGIVASISNKLI